MTDPRERRRQERNSSWTGIALTVAVHVCIVVVGFFTGLKYIYPPPEEEAMLIDFSEDVPMPVIEERTGREPKSAEPDPDREIELVQRSEGQVKGTELNEAPEATVGEKGDVEIPEPPRKKEINRRALFHAADNKTSKDTLAQQTAAEVTDELKAGHAVGTADTGKIIGKPTARLQGRSTEGFLPAPAAPGQNTGSVIVKIWVDNYGKVKKAEIDIEKTTVSDSDLWKTSLAAARQTKFNMKADAPVMQEGTITYIFKLN